MAHPPSHTPTSIGLPQLQRWMRTNTRRRRSRTDNLKSVVLASVLASVLFGLSTYWVGLSVQQQRADMSDQFAFIKAAVLAHAMSGAMGPDGTPRLPCPDLNGNGRAAFTCGPGELEGYVPWRTLGIDREETLNAWGIPVIYKIDRPNADTCSGRLPRQGGLIMTRSMEQDDDRSILNAVFVLQSVRPTRSGQADLTFVDAGTGSLFLGLCQNADTMRTVQF